MIGLKTRIIANGMQGMLFTVIWKVSLAPFCGTCLSRLTLIVFVQGLEDKWKEMENAKKKAQK